MEFQFTLYRTYQKGVIEDYNAVNVSFFVDILLSGHDYLHSSHINVQINLESKLTRSCRETVRPQTTVIDIIVVAVSLLASLGYLLSVIRSAQLAKVRMFRSPHTFIATYINKFYNCLYLRINVI